MSEEKLTVEVSRPKGTNRIVVKVKNPTGKEVECRMLQSVQDGDQDDNVHWRTDPAQLKSVEQEFELQEPSENFDYEAKIDVYV